MRVLDTNATRPGGPGFVYDRASGRKDRRRTRRTPHAPVLAVTSGKGGVGKTNVVANLAASLARRGKRILAIDADPGLANLDLLLGVKPAYTLADFFAGAAALEEILAATGDGILLLPGASGVQEATALRPEQKAALLTELDAMTRALDLVLIDTGSGISDAVTYFTTAAQEIVVVATPEPSSMTDAYALIKVLSSAHRQKRFWVLANNAASAAEAREVYEALSRTALRFLNASLDFLGWIPRDPALARAVARSRPVVDEAPGSPSAIAFAALAGRVVEIAAGTVTVKGGVQFFFRRLLEREREER
ncbi:MAG TPA: MinD/ParA family protein [candidate division Zixibacteria bacterium]|nr:MinD/ParA family protein [candidate division Zixibacteria bacterium]